LSNQKNIYLVSDLHLGAPNHEQSLKREKHFVRWLSEIAYNAQELYLLGDIFDFWFEYKHAIPKGYIRVLGKLAEMSDRGVAIHIFAGNHDLWYRTYFVEQMGATIHHGPIIKNLLGRKCYLAHGDGLGPGDHGYKFLKFVLTNPLSHWLFEWLHPNFGIGLADLSSSLSRNANERKPRLKKYQGEKEYLHAHALNMNRKQPDIQYFVFGHRHILVEDEFVPKTKLIILGDWINHFSYLEINADEVALQTYPMPECDL